MRPCLLMLLLGCSSLALAQEAPPAAEKAPEAVKPSVKKLDDTRYQVGEVIFDEKSREIRFPAKVNMTDGLLEYLIVHQNGKTHEALLATEISATDLNLAFTLLRYPPSRELYAIEKEPGVISDKFPDVPADVKAAARVTIDVEWTDNGKVRRNPINEWVQHGVKATSMPAGPWVYGGSDFSEGKFGAEVTGDIAAIFLARSALLLYPGEDREDDTVWTSFPKRVPPTGTPVTVIIAPYQNAKPLPKP